MALLRVNHHPKPRELRAFATAWALVIGMIGLFQWMEGRETLARACWAAAVVVPLGGAVWREGLRCFYVALTYAVFPLGWLVSTAVLLGLYYGVLTPIGLVLRVRRHDPLQQTPAARADSYWRPRSARRPAASYFRQH
ncbi:MAG: hypothetical protein HYX71_06095 [Opitutae bacterium]|nr:hypothetical protein [Opitutae bacterium]